MAAFIPGLQLCRFFYEEAVRPILARHWPSLHYSAALIGSGSEVLGFDTAQSTDHHWGPRLMVFLGQADRALWSHQIDEALQQQLPREILGVPTSFGEPDAIGVRLLKPTTSGPVQHMVSIVSLEEFWNDYLGLDPARPLSLHDWLVLPQQKLLSVVSGGVFHDGLNRLEALRQQLAWYPHDVWLYMMATQWMRVSQEEAFVGRCGDVNDELGSRIMATRLVRDVMKLCFLIERRYAPYSKWFGTAFARLRCGPQLVPIFDNVLQARDWKERERLLAEAYCIVAGMHNALGLTAPLPTTVSSFHDRPYQVIHGDRFADVLQAAITDPAVKALPKGVGAVDQFVDCTDIYRSGSERSRAMLGVYGLP